MILWEISNHKDVKNVLLNIDCETFKSKLRRYNLYPSCCMLLYAPQENSCYLEERVPLIKFLFNRLDLWKFILNEDIEKFNKLIFKNKLPLKGCKDGHHLIDNIRQIECASF